MIERVQFQDFVLFHLQNAVIGVFYEKGFQNLAGYAKAEVMRQEKSI